MIMADWPLNYIIQNFKQFFLPLPEILVTQRAVFAHRMDAPGSLHHKNQIHQYIVNAIDTKSMFAQRACRKTLNQ